VLLPDFQQLVDDLVRDRDQVIAPSERATAIASALSRYSADSPRPCVEDVISVSGGPRLPVPTGWLEGVSELRALEYPVGKVPPSQIGLDAVSLYQSPTGIEIVMLLSVFADDVVRVSYTGGHVLDATQTTIPSRHVHAVAAFAASILCGQLSAYYATEGAPTLQADTVDHQGKTERYRNRARDLAAEYTRTVGAAQPERQRPGMAEVAIPGQSSLGGRPMFHPPRRWPR
jgi:hypothetical protein